LVTTQKTPFFIVTDVKTSNLTIQFRLRISTEWIDPVEAERLSG
jgi:hypothetical protein